jgi:hypothetical protein
VREATTLRLPSSSSTRRGSGLRRRYTDDFLFLVAAVHEILEIYKAGSLLSPSICFSKHPIELYQHPHKKKLTKPVYHYFSFVFCRFPTAFLDSDRYIFYNWSTPFLPPSSSSIDSISSYIFTSFSPYFLPVFKISRILLSFSIKN